MFPSFEFVVEVNYEDFDQWLSFWLSQHDYQFCFNASRSSTIINIEVLEKIFLVEPDIVLQSKQNLWQRFNNWFDELLAQPDILAPRYKCDHEITNFQLIRLSEDRTQVQSWLNVEWQGFTLDFLIAVTKAYEETIPTILSLLKQMEPICSDKVIQTYLDLIKQNITHDNQIYSQDEIDIESKKEAFDNDEDETNKALNYIEEKILAAFSKLRDEGLHTSDEAIAAHLPESRKGQPYSRETVNRYRNNMRKRGFDV